MKTWLVMFVVVWGCGVLCRGEPTNSLAIYLVAGQVPENITAYSRGDWSHFRLSDSPFFFVDDTLIDVATNPPFTGKWVMLSAGGTHTLLAVASYKGTTSDDISRPVTVSFGGASVFSRRKLPGGEFMFYYSVSGPAGQAVPSINSADDLLTLLSSRDELVVLGSGVYN